MRKTSYFVNLSHFRMAVVIVALLCVPGLPGASFLSAQQQKSQTNTQKRVTGVVKDEVGMPVPGVNIRVIGTSNGTVTNLDGKYSVTVPTDNTQLEFTFIGYDTQRAIAGKELINIQLQPSDKKLNEVIVVGYGTQRKKDLTGSIASVGSKDFNSGVSGNPADLINGKVAGVQIMSNSGSPSSGSSIRIRGGASLNASNDPLIVIDGVPLESSGIKGNDNNFLSLLNPNDIENISILKDASSTAIYGSRASNGVMMITTKKGNLEKLKFNFSTSFSLQQKTRTADMLTAQQFRDLITEKGTDAQKALLGNTTTNWNDQIFQTAVGNDNNFSVSGGIAQKVPFRASFGYMNQDGILKTDNVKRMSGSFVVTPSFFENHLKVNFNVKGSVNDNKFANNTAIWTAAAFNPTQPIYSGNSNFGGYYETIDNTGLPVVKANLNPLGLLTQENNTSTVKRSISNLDLDYKLHFLPELKAHVTLGYDYAKGSGSVYIPESAASNSKTGGRNSAYSQTRSNKLFTAYLNYVKDFEPIKSRLDLTVGHDYQNWLAETPQYNELNVAGDVQSITAADYQRHVLLSYYARLNYSFDSRYLLTATVRRDGTSRFSTDNRWGTFPSLAFAWRAKEESFLKDFTPLSDLKVRVGYGITGQQEGISNYSYLPVYVLGNEYAQYKFGNTYYNTYRPAAYFSNLKWETTTAYNAGIDFGFFDNRISGSIDFYNRKTKDLLANVPLAAGANFSDAGTTNVGNVKSNGVEFSINAEPVKTKDFTWSVGFNATYQKVEITNLSMVKGTTSIGSFVGPSVGGRGLQIMTEGYTPYMFYVYKQVYGTNGKPIEGMYADLNKDGVVNDKDLYRYHSPMPDFILGFNSQFSYKKWTAGFTLRASIGNYVYNNMKANQGSLETLQYNSYELNNLSSDYLNTGFTTRQFYSDYFVENASYLKMDNISLGYNVGKIMKGVNLRLGAMVQNVFTITNYSGVDPEVPSGFDSQFYPRPRTISMNLNLDF